MAHHFSMRLASLALAAVTALGVSSAVPAFADTHHGGGQDQRSAMRSDNNDHGQHHRRGECREGFRKSEHTRRDNNRDEKNNRREDCEVVFHHKFVHKHHHTMEPRREVVMSRH